MCARSFAAANQVAPGAGTDAVSGRSCTCAHQSTAPTYSALVRGLYAAPFHSTPPRNPGQKRTVLSRDSGTSTLARVVVGICQTSDSAPAAPLGRLTRERSSTDSCPSLLADATMGRPEGVTTSVGGLSTSQSCASRVTIWL